MSLTAARIRALNAVIDEGTYAGAARRLGLTQPAIRQAITELEQAFNVSLFQRRRRMLVPTEVCLELGPVVAEMTRLEDQARFILQSSQKLEMGILRVGLGNAMPGMAVIGGFQQRFPRIQVVVEMGNYADIIDAVLRHGVDVGVLPNVPDDRRFHRKVCLQQDVVAIVQPGHELAGRRVVTVPELRDQRLIFRSAGSATQRVMDAAFRQAGFQPEPAIVLETRDGVCEAVANGLGVGFIWRHGTSRSDGLVRVPIADMERGYEEVVFRRSDTTNPIVEMFFMTVDHVRFE